MYKVAHVFQAYSLLSFIFAVLERAGLWA